jgi:hypothetical protein
MTSIQMRVNASDIAKERTLLRLSLYSRFDLIVCCSMNEAILGERPP